MSGIIVGSDQHIRIKVRDCRRSLTAPAQYQLRGRWVTCHGQQKQNLLARWQTKQTADIASKGQLCQFRDPRGDRGSKSPI